MNMGRYVAESKEAYDQINFWEGAAHVILGELDVSSYMVLEVFGSNLAYFREEESIGRYETYEEFERRYIDKRRLIECSTCVARISPEPVLVFPF